MFGRIVDGTGKTLWAISREQAAEVCKRSDMTAILAQLVKVAKEHGMYPLLNMAAEIILLCAASKKLDDVPDPYYVEENGGWVKAPTTGELGGSPGALSTDRCSRYPTLWPGFRGVVSRVN